MALRNEKSLCESCRFKKICEGKNDDSDMSKVVMCPQWEKENGSEKDRRFKRN